MKSIAHAAPAVDIQAAPKLHKRNVALDRARIERQTQESRLQAMQATIEPEFLFDTLAHVESLQASDPKGAARMLDDLIVYLRAALPQLLPLPAQSAAAQAGGVRLLGFDVSGTPLRPGEALPLTLYWQAVTAQHAGLQLQLLLGAVELYSGGPLAGSYPSAAWQTGEVLLDKMLPRLPRTVSDGHSSAPAETSTMAIRKILSMKNFTGIQWLNLIRAL